MGKAKYKIGSIGKQRQPAKHCLLGMVFCVIVLLRCNAVHAQRNEQLWLDYQLDYPFGGQYLFETTGSYQTVLTSEGKWRSLSLTPTFEYQHFRVVDFLLNIPLVYTLQAEDVNSFEIGPSVGARIHITQNRRVNVRVVTKLEERFQRQVEQNDWDQSNRFRIKGEIWTAINGPNLFADKLFYCIVDYEEFIVTDQQLDERFANRRRGRIGLGYRKDYRNRFELIYTRQSSRNELAGDFISGDNVIQLRYKMFLNPSKKD